MKAKKIDVEYTDTPGEQFVLLFSNGGLLREADGSVKLYFKPF